MSFKYYPDTHAHPLHGSDIPCRVCVRRGHWIPIIIDIIPSRVLSGLWKLRAVIDQS